MRRPRVIIVGGGLAGMACATAIGADLTEVTLIEARSTLGGRAGSFVDPQTGQTLDNCQHVLLGCCTNLLDFYRRIGTTERIQHFDAVHFLDDQQRWFDLRADAGVPAPFHLARAMLRFGLLTPMDRIHLARALAEMMSMGRAGRLALHDIPFGEWLDEMHQPLSLRKRLYEPMLVGSLNEQITRVSASYAIQVFQDALLSNADGYRLGLPACPLGELYRSIPNCRVLLNTRVAELTFDRRRRASGVILSDGTPLPGDAVVVATNHHGIAGWIPQPLLDSDSRFAGLYRLESVPILGAHLWFDRPVMDRGHAALISGPLQWIFRKNESGNAVHGVISAAGDWVGMPRETMLDLFARQVRRRLPGAAEATMIRGNVIIEKRATFSPLPGSDRFRPSPGPPPGGIAGLYLAGDYVRTGWPSTMEGAVRGGYLAAEAIAADAGTPRTYRVADLPVDRPARWLGMEDSPKPL